MNAQISPMNLFAVISDVLSVCLRSSSATVERRIQAADPQGTLTADTGTNVPFQRDDLVDVLYAPGILCQVKQ